MKYEVWHEISTEEILNIKGKNKKINIPLLIRLIMTKSCFQYAKAYPRLSEVYIYSKNQGYYIQLTANELKSLIFKLLLLLDPEFSHSKTLNAVFTHVFLGLQSAIGKPEFDTDVMVFTNGTYHFHTNTFTPWSPSDFVINRVEYPYIPDAKCPSILNFLHALCCNHQDRLHFLRCWLWALVRSYQKAQIFLYIQGPGRTGKSIFAHLASALVGRDAVVTTSLKALNNDPFEVSNLTGKKLISIVDSVFYRGDIAVLKMLSGNDTLMGRIKYAQGSSEITPQGLVLIVSNFGSLDTSGAIQRRMRIIPAEGIISPEQVNPDLLTVTKSGFTGILFEEMPGLFSWVNEVTEIDVYDTLSKPFLPSTEQHVLQSADELNPIMRWAKCELEPGLGCYLGCKLTSNLQGENEFQLRKPLYPAYERWSRREGVKALSTKLFSLNIVEVLNSIGFSAKKERRGPGYFITGIQLKNEIFLRDYNLAAPMVSTAANISSKSTSADDSGNLSTPVNKSNTPSFLRGEKLYDSYIALLHETEMKLTLNKVSRELNYDINTLVTQYSESCIIKSPAYIEGIHTIFKKGQSIVQKFGAVPFSYKQMGISPRIVPRSYKDSIHSVKKYLRDCVYTDLTHFSRKNAGYSIIDLDIKSCYISILLGLYPNELCIVQNAMENVGLWNYIQTEFDRQGKNEVYNKSLAKICVYSSLFQGGHKAIVKGIFEHYRKELGLNPREFRNSPVFQDVYKIANETAYLLNNSNIISSFRILSQKILAIYQNGELAGPTGHSYAVNDLNFRSSFPNYLQSYEFFLIANTILQLKHKFDFELLGHYHDGIVLCLPEKSISEFELAFEQTLNDIRILLGLSYSVGIETKKY